MKQARAFGVGVMIATQNPMDLDYRALGNAGVWCTFLLQPRWAMSVLRGPMTRNEIKKALELPVVGSPDIRVA